MVVNAMEKKQGEDVQVVVDGMVIVVTSEWGEGELREVVNKHCGKGGSSICSQRRDSCLAHSHPLLNIW